MMLLNTKHIKILGLLYLCLPVLIFFMGWLHWYFSIPLSILVCYCFCLFTKNTESQIIEVPRGKLIIALSIIFVWTFLSGIGRYTYQNADHLWRNAIFNDLIYSDWPVNNGTYSLCYYLGFWLPSALLGKLFHSLALGNVLQLLWAWFGMSLFYLLISIYLKKFKIGILFILIFFSGIDIIGYSFNVLKRDSWGDLWRYLTDFSHIEWSHGDKFQASSITTLVYWVFNQAIPFFVGMMLILLNKNIKYLLFLFSLLLLFSPFPFIGLFPVVVYWYINELARDGFIKFVKNQLTIENLTAILTMLVVGLYFTSNISAGESGFRDITSHYMFFLITQYFVYVVFIFKTNRKDPVFLVLLGTAILFPLVRMGSAADFCMRTNIPFIIYMMLLVMKYLYDADTPKYLKTLVLCIFFMGAFTPFFEIARSVRMTSIQWSNHVDGELKITDEDSIFDEGLIGDNFLGGEDSFFVRFLAKK